MCWECSQQQQQAHNLLIQGAPCASTAPKKVHRPMLPQGWGGKKSWAAAAAAAALAAPAAALATSAAASELGQDVGGVQHVELLAARGLHRVAGVLEVDDAVALLDLQTAKWSEEIGKLDGETGCAAGCLQ